LRHQGSQNGITPHCGGGIPWVTGDWNIALPRRAQRDRHGSHRVRPGLLGDKFLPGFFYNTLPLPMVAGLVAAIVYGAAAALWLPPQTAVPAPESPAAQQGSAS
jgi:hypothetical protein